MRTALWQAGDFGHREQEETQVMRVPIDAAHDALSGRTIHNGPLIVALQWLALNRGRLAEVAAPMPAQ